MHIMMMGMMYLRAKENEKKQEVQRKKKEQEKIQTNTPIDNRHQRSKKIDTGKGTAVLPHPSSSSAWQSSKVLPPKASQVTNGKTPPKQATTTGYPLPSPSKATKTPTQGYQSQPLPWYEIDNRYQGSKKTDTGKGTAILPHPSSSSAWQSSKVLPPKASQVTNGKTPPKQATPTGYPSPSPSKATKTPTQGYQSQPLPWYEIDNRYQGSKKTDTGKGTAILPHPSSSSAWQSSKVLPPKASQVTNGKTPPKQATPTGYPSPSPSKATKTPTQGYQSQPLPWYEIDNRYQGSKKTDTGKGTAVLPHPSSSSAWQSSKVLPPKASQVTNGKTPPKQATPTGYPSPSRSKAAKKPFK